MQQTFRCPECGAEFPTQQALEEHVTREHMGTQTQVPPQNCPACSVEFPTAGSLKEHEKTHQPASAG
jgi:C2H2-type zinc finger